MKTKMMHVCKEKIGRNFITLDLFCSKWLLYALECDTEMI